MIARLFVAFSLLSIINYQLSIASAQKYPERRTTRQGTKLYNEGNYTEAEARYRQAAELNPGLREAAFNLGGALWRQAAELAVEQTEEQGDGQEAMQQKIEEAANVWTAIAADSLAPAPMVSAASYNVGNMALAGQQIDQAIEAYKQSLRLRPDDMEAKFNLAYAQKLKQQQEQNQDQNDEQNDEQENQNNDQNDQNDDQQGEGESDPQDSDGENDPKEGEGDQPPPPSGNGEGEAKIDPRAAEQMLDAMQAAEDDTREKVNAKEVQVGARSGKNW